MSWAELLVAQRQDEVSDGYWRGYRHGRRIAEHATGVDAEPVLRLELAMHTAPANRVYRAFALGELRGYRTHRED